MTTKANKQHDAAAATGLHADAAAVDTSTGEILNAPSITNHGWPEGFEEYDLSYDNYETWDWDTKPLLVGQVTQTKTVNLKRRGVATDVLMMIVMVGDTEHAIWETAQLKKYMQDSFAGQHVAIRYQGMIDLPGGRRMRDFKVGTRG